MKYKITKDYKLTPQGKKIYRIEALKDFADVRKGDLGGYISSESNLSQEGDCWVYDNAMVFGNAKVYGYAMVCDNAWVFGDAWVFDDAWVFGQAKIFDDAWVFGDDEVTGD